MPSTGRRTLLASFGAVALGSVAGCASIGSERPPAGSLQFGNDHVVPHSVTMRVDDVGSEPGDRQGDVEGDPLVPPNQRRLTASTVVDPGERRTYEGVFTEPVWYGVRFTVDGDDPEESAGSVAFHPAPADGEEGTFLSGRVQASGQFTWTVHSTGDPGPFER